MKISSLILNNNFFNRNNISNPIKYPNLSPLKTDTVSFGAMTKAKFSGIDLLVINKFKAPIEKFNTNADLQNWCSDRIDEIKSKKYEGRDDDTDTQREEILKEWYDYLSNNNDKYTNAMSLLILDGLVKNLKCNNANLPPNLDEKILNSTLKEILDKLKREPNLQLSFGIIYETKLNEKYIAQIKPVQGENKDSQTGWVIIPSRKNDPRNFKENVKMLKILSNNSWCTKSNKTEEYLSEGDFHLYFEKGKPKLAVRFVGDKVYEIQGEKNNAKIPLRYLALVEQYLRPYEKGRTAKNEFEAAYLALDKAREMVTKLKEKGLNIRNCTVEQLFNVIGIETKYDDEGKLILSEYKQPDKGLTFDDLEIDENELLKDVVKIEGDADFESSYATNLKNLKYIGGKANFKKSYVINLKNLKYIGGDADFMETKQIPELDNLIYIGGYAWFENSRIENLDKLEYIGGEADFSGAKRLTNLKNLKAIGKNAWFEYSPVVNLESLKYIGLNAYFRNSFISDLDNLEYIGSTAQFYNTQHLKSLKNLKRIEGSANFLNSAISDLDNLEYVGGDADFYNAKNLKSLKNLKEVHGNFRIAGSSLTKADINPELVLKRF